MASVAATKLEVANGEVACNYELRACPHNLRCGEMLTRMPKFLKRLWKTRSKSRNSTEEASGQAASSRYG